MNKEVEPKDIQEEINELVITIRNENDEEIDCTVLTTFPVGRYNYIALLPHTADENGNVNIQLYRYKEVMQDGQEGISISNIASDMEFDEALKVFETLVED